MTFSGDAEKNTLKLGEACRITKPYLSDSTAIRQQQRASAAQAGLRLGERLRQLRVAAAMTQTDLAGDRFSKEYVSQIERGKTRPTRETIEWLAVKLGVDPGFLERGVSADERRRVDTLLARADALTESHSYAEATGAYENCRTAVLATGVTELEVRHLAGEAWARMENRELKQAIERRHRARMP